MSAIVLWVMCAVIVAALAAWLVVVALAQRRPGTERPKTERRRGRVQGGSHTGGGRSVGPTRDEPAVAGEDPEKPSVANRPEAARETRGPLDL